MTADTGNDPQSLLAALESAVHARRHLDAFRAAGRLADELAGRSYLANLAPAQWGEERMVGGQIVTVAGCTLQALIELGRILGQIEATSQLWDTRARASAG